MDVSFPRANARTQGFSRGAPRSFQLDPTGRRLLFVRSAHGTDPMGALWSLDVVTGAETLVADPRALLGSDDENLSPAERARRERSREGAGGIVGFATDRAGTVAAFALSSRLWVADVEQATVRELPAAGPVLDPRPDPTGTWVAYVSGGALHVSAVDGTTARVLAEPEKPDVAWGVAEFVAAEEMDRHRGYWWSPDGDAVLAARVDDGPVQRWHIADPSNPATPATEIRYPVAGSADSDVTLHVLDLDGGRVDVDWDRDAFPYLVRADWSTGGAVLQVMSRDQCRAQVLAVDPTTGGTTLLVAQSDPVWLDAVVGVPALLPDGRLISTADRDGARRLLIDDGVVTPPDVQVDKVLSVDEEDGVVLLGTDDPVESHLWRWTPGGGLVRLSERGAHYTGIAAGGTTVLVRRRASEPLPTVTVHREGVELRLVRSYAETPPLHPSPRFLRVGARDLVAGVVLPRDHVAGTRVPVLMYPYGGPHHREAVDIPERWREAQWMADQGFAVVKADGRGTGARGPVWDREIRDEFASVALADQVEALHAVAEQVPDLDLDRVGILGWSFGGYLAALAVLRRPDVFHAAVAGAPVVDWRLYDTFYTERYLGHPDKAPEVYDRNSLLGDAPNLERPLLLIHGLADDNVVVAHTLRLSAALLAAGRPHDVLPLTGVTHMTPQDVVAENRLRLELEWLTRNLPRAG